MFEEKAALVSMAQEKSPQRDSNLFRQRRSLPFEDLLLGGWEYVQYTRITSCKIW